MTDKLSRNKLVVKANRLIEAKYKLTVREQKFILFISSLIDKDDKDFKYKKLRIKDVEDVLKGDETKKWGSIYEVIREITVNLNQKPLSIRTETGTWQIIYWFASLEFEESKGMVTFEFSEKLRPFLLQLKGLFTKYRFQNILNLRSGYSIRIYELLKLNQFKGKVRYELSLFRELIGASHQDPATKKMVHKYEEYKAFKRSILKHAQKEIERETDIYFELKEERESRKVKYLVFYVFKNENNEKKSSAIFSEPTPEEVPEQESNERIIEQFIAIGVGEQQAREIYLRGFNEIKQKEIRRQIVEANRGLDEYLQEKIDYVLAQKTKGTVLNPPGLLIKAIQENYHDPEAKKQKAKKAAASKRDKINQKSASQKEVLKQMHRELYQKERVIIDRIVGANATIFDELVASANLSSPAWASYDEAKSAIDNFQDASGALKAKFESFVKKEFVGEFSELKGMEGEIKKFKAKLR